MEYNNYNMEEIQKKLKKYGQGHLLNFYDTLDENKQKKVVRANREYRL